jgi:Na+:H+ antiporter, NhaA family
MIVPGPGQASGYARRVSTPEAVAGAGRTVPRRRLLVQQVAAPVRSFIATESGSAGLLLAATIAALIWINAPFGDTYEEFWTTELSIRFGDHALTEDLRSWVNDGLMVFFFLVVGLEVRREIAVGELTDRRRLTLPAIAATAGMAVPALIYLALNPSGDAAHGWGVAVSTDTAFVLGALALVGPACPVNLRVFLLTLSIVDDVGALLIIAIFYSDDVSPLPLVIALACVLAILLLGRLRVWRGPAYVILGTILWVAMLESGVHPAIAGVLIAAGVSVYSPRREEVEEVATLARAFRQSPVPELARSTKLSVARAISPNERLQTLLHPWTSYVVVPVFALANAGVVLDAGTLAEAATSRVTLGVVAGLVLGKLIAVGPLTMLAARLGLGRLPRGVSWPDLLGGAALSGIGFTVSLFIAELAFDSPDLRDDAKIGILAASLLAGLLGWAIFRVLELRRRARGDAGGPVMLDPPVDPARDHIRGPVDAPLTLVEFADFECPFCGRATGVVEELRERFGDRLRYVMRHLPLTDVHPNAELAAEAAEAAGAQGRFWEMHDRLFRHQDELGPDELVDHARAISLDVERFVMELDDGVHSERVREDVASAEASRVTGTPTFFVGARRHSGRYDAETLAVRLLASAGQAEGGEGAQAALSDGPRP